MKVLDHFWLWLILLFVGYVLVAGTPEGRIVRLCEPINWGGRLIESLTLVVAPGKASTVGQGVASTERSCRAMMYRQMYPQQISIPPAGSAVDAAKGVAKEAAKAVPGAAK